MYWKFEPKFICSTCGAVATGMEAKCPKCGQIMDTDRQALEMQTVLLAEMQKHLEGLSKVMDAAKSKGEYK